MVRIGCVLVAGLLAAVVGPAYAAVNLLPQGNFVNPSVKTGWASGFHDMYSGPPAPLGSHDPDACRVVVADGKHWLRLENQDPHRSVDWDHAYIRLTPQIKALTISARMRGWNIKPGPQSWQDACIGLQFTGPHKSWYAPHVPQLTSGSTGVTVTVHDEVPPGATSLGIQPALFNCTGVFEITDLKVTPELAHPSPPTNAVLPPHVQLNWQELQITNVNPDRSKVSLNGIWRFAPAAKGSSAPPKLGWGYIRVPGNWDTPLKGRGSAFIAPGGGPAWDLYDGSQVALAWYERKVPIPAAWRGRVISLRFGRVSTDAIIYVNGKRCGEVAQLGTLVNITHAVTPGQTADIRVLVAATTNKKVVATFWQNAFFGVTYSPYQLTKRGLLGDVTLTSRRSVAYIRDVFVQTSTRKKRLTLNVDLGDVTQSGPVRFVAEMLGPNGTVQKTFTATAAVTAKPMQTISASWPWRHPHLWDLDHPYLYTMRLKASGPQLDDQYDQVFGFREFWIQGRQFYLNGTKIRLRQGPFSYSPPGTWGDNFSEGGNPNWADHHGYLLALPLPNICGDLLDHPIPWATIRRQLSREMRQNWNHPSVVMWSEGFDFFNSSVSPDPRNLGEHGFDETSPRWKALMAAGGKLFDLITKLDPTRPSYSHAGGDVGDVFTLNLYLDMIPLQERDQWLSHWAKHGVMPLLISEFGPPTPEAFRRGRMGFASNVTSEPLLTEWAAIYFGPKAYQWDGARYRLWLHNLFAGGWLYHGSEHEFGQEQHFKDYAALERLFRTQTGDCWRTAGLSGGTRFWCWTTYALKKINFPTLAWIAGRPGAYTSQAHHYASGQTFQKQIVLINDTRQPQSFTATWAATVGGQTIGHGELHGTLGVAEIHKIPISITAPQIASGSRTNGQITLTATIGKAMHHDQFAFRVYGAEKPASGTIAIVDPVGLTSKMIRHLGYTLEPWHGQKAPLLVIGRDGLKDDPGIAPKLEPFVRAGGRVLIFEQDPAWLTKTFGFRVCPEVVRYVFPIPNSPVTNGINATDLCNWNGSSTLIPAYPHYIVKGYGTSSTSYLRRNCNYMPGNEVRMPYAGWHWGNRGGVSSAAIEKPHMSGWTPLLQCEFDLAYTPLMEMNFGRGRVIMCTLDLADHMDPAAKANRDPAAKLMALHVLNYALHASLAPRMHQVVYLGNAAGQAWLKKIGVAFTPAGALPADPGLVLIGPKAPVTDAALKAYLQQGGRAFFLPQTQAQGWLGATLQRAPSQFAGSLSVPDWPQALGLSASDLRWETFMNTPPWILSGGCDVGANGLLGREKIGQGVAVFCQINPQAFDATNYTYFHYTQWRATRAVAQVLANLGASFPVDARIFHPLVWTANLNDGPWEMKVTRRLPPLAGGQLRADPGVSPTAQALIAPTAPAAGWTQVNMPRITAARPDYDGEAVFRKTISVPADEAGKAMILSLGAIHDVDNAYFNGVQVGHTGEKTPHWSSVARNYTVPGKLVHAGENVIAVRVFAPDREGLWTFAPGYSNQPLPVAPDGDVAGPQSAVDRGWKRTLRPDPVGAQRLGWYCPDYRTAFPMGDNPYRYYRF